MTIDQKTQEDIFTKLNALSAAKIRANKEWKSLEKLYTSGLKKIFATEDAHQAHDKSGDSLFDNNPNNSYYFI